MCLIAVKNGKVNIRYCPSAVNSGSRHLSPANRSFADHNAIILLQNSLRSAQCAINCGELRGLDARAPDQGVGGKVYGHRAKPGSIKPDPRVCRAAILRCIISSSSERKVWRLVFLCEE